MRAACGVFPGCLFALAQMTAVVSQLSSPSVANPYVSYYVMKTGNDFNPGSLAQPFLTIGRAISAAAPGDQIWIGAGTYLEQINISTVGTALAPVTVRAIRRQTVLISPPLASGYPSRATVILSGSYITLANLRIQGWKGNPQAPASDHFMSNVITVNDGALYNSIINSELYDGLHCGIKGGVNSAIYLTVSQCNIHDNGTTSLDHGVYGGGHSSFTGNTINNNAGYGLHLYSGMPAFPASVLADRNSFTGNGGGAILIGGPDAVVTNNTGTGNASGIGYFRLPCTNPTVTHNQMFGNANMDVWSDNCGGACGGPSGITDDWNIYKRGKVPAGIPYGANECIVAGLDLVGPGCGPTHVDLRPVRRQRPR